MEKLSAIAADATDKFVRVRWQVDEEHRQSVDREAVEALFAQAAGLKVEARILSVVRSRSQGISLETTVDRKIERWAEHANVEAAPLVERFQLLESGFVEAIAAAVLAGLEAGPDTGGASDLDLTAEGVDDRHAETTDDALPVATVEVMPVTQKSWLDDDLFAA